MSALKTMLQYGGGGGTVAVDSMVVYHTSVDNMENGGCCCLWTVPTGVTWFAVEMWGGGGGGAGNCCCFFGIPGGAGSYARKIITTVAGQQYRFCAGGSTTCANTNTGCPGYPSYAYGVTEAANVICASAGKVGCNYCWGPIGTSYMGCSAYECGSWCGGFGICGMSGAFKGTAFCSGTAWNWAPQAPFTGDFFRPARDACSGYCCGCGQQGYAYWPGSGGGTASSHNSYCGCGAAGAGGLIIVEWHVAS
jgi:hypothetical protein